jgi:hypothetical protein
MIDPETSEASRPDSDYYDDDDDDDGGGVKN